MAASWVKNEKSGPSLTSVHFVVIRNTHTYYILGKSCRLARYLYLLYIMLVQCFSKRSPWAPATIGPGNLLEIQILRTPPSPSRPTESETLGLEPNNLFQQAFLIILIASKFWDLLPSFLSPPVAKQAIWSLQSNAAGFEGLEVEWMTETCIVAQWHYYLKDNCKSYRFSNF